MVLNKVARSTYYTLVASLPQLRHFESAEWLPLSRKQLNERLSMLTPEDAQQLRLAEHLVRWQRQPITRTSEQVAQEYKWALPQIHNAPLREFVQYRMAQRTALAVLRRRKLGLPMPAPDDVWGVGPWLRLMTNNWDRNDLGLSHLLPWISEAALLLEAGSAIQLEQLLMDVVWTRLGRIAERSTFGFEPVIGFVFRWDIVQRWLSYDADKAKIRFQQLVTEVTREQQQLFA
ncbi:MAG: hypothetical protein ACI8QT_001722 [Halioglobus sp.]|jgi:hypothetical protein